MGLGHGISHDLVLQGTQDGLQEVSGHEVGKEFLALGEKFELVQRSQQHRGSRVEYRVGEIEVLRVLGQCNRHVVVAHPGEEQHQVVVEVVAQFLLHVAYRPHLQQAAQAGAGGTRHPRHDLHLAL